MDQENQTPQLNDNGLSVNGTVPASSASAETPAAENTAVISAEPANLPPETGAQSFIPSPEGYIPPTEKKKRSLLWLWITLPVLAVALVVVILILCLKPGAPNFQSAPSAYLASAVTNTGGAIAESFDGSPFAAITASCEGINDLQVEMSFQQDLSDMGGYSIGMTLSETFSQTQKAFMGSLSLQSGEEDFGMGVYSDETTMLLQLDDTGWKGFSFDTFAQDFKNSVFAPDSGSSFALTQADAAQFAEVVTLLQSFWSASKNAGSGPVFDGDALLTALTGAFPQPEIGKAAYTISGEEKSYDAYTYHFSGEDLARVEDAFWGAVENDAFLTSFFDGFFSSAGLDDPRGVPAAADPNAAFDLTVAFHQNNMVAATFSFPSSDTHIELLFGEDPAKASEMSFTLRIEDQALFSIVRNVEHPSGAQGFSDTFTLTMHDAANDSAGKPVDASFSFGVEWDKTTGDLAFVMGASSNDTPVTISLEGTMNAGSKGKGFSLDIDELAVKIYTIRQSLPLKFHLSAMPGQTITKPADWENLMQMDEAAVDAWLYSFITIPEYV